MFYGQTPMANCGGSQLNCLRLSNILTISKLLRKASRFQVIQNSAPSVAGRRQCDIRILQQTILMGNGMGDTRVFLMTELKNG